MRTRPLCLGLAAAGLAWSMTGCVATQRDVIELENQTDELKFQVLELKKTITSLQSNQADMLVSMKQLHGDLGVFTETVKDLQGNMDKLASKMDDLGSGITNLGTGITSRVSALGETIKESEQQQKKEVAEERKKAEEEKRKAAQALSVASPTDLFFTADYRLNKKDFALAAKGFEEYVNRFPDGALIDVALYNLGESYFGLGQWEPAGRQFAAALERFPKSKMTPSSRLMYALCLVKMKKNIPEARQYLESIPQDFPRSPEAKAAAEHLKKLPREAPARRSKP